MKKLKTASLVCLSLLSIGLTGCVTVDSIFGQEDKPISSVEMQALQTREYDADYVQVFAAVIGAFQTYGYTINQADRETGLISGKTPTTAEMNMMFVRNEYQGATAFVEQVGKNRVKVRISLVKHVSASGSYGQQGEKEAAITRSEPYRDIFNKVQQSLFLKKNL